ncbi:hypothetical protein [Desulfoscipio gibsoniae]|uniref:Uncharacterized protein n=1 Tax=Desulfoscipio gibsoniae DSM 7213 TaxID=767817 RepID=R4KHK2_9FIRM|nr:hypothetical protein [Desulfoscipio gibsoniae]AGL02693.1 hypothetical protein Desgi_3348 [Desulfoscipio gibsoniae DSM 7213]
MIQVGTVWTYIFAPNVDNKVAGKWIYEGNADLFRQLCPKLNKLADNGAINMAKFANKNPRHDPCPYIKNSVLCVYTHKPRDKKIRLIIKNELDLWSETYKTEEQTNQEWRPGGILFEQYAHYWKNKRGFL